MRGKPKGKRLLQNHTELEAFMDEFEVGCLVPTGPVEIYNQGRIPEYFQTGYSESHKLNIG